MNTSNANFPSRTVIQCNKNKEAKLAIDSFLNAIKGIGYQKNEIINIVKEELK